MHRYLTLASAISDSALFTGLVRRFRASNRSIQKKELALRNSGMAPVIVADGMTTVGSLAQ
jgi:hypothetical protein